MKHLFVLKVVATLIFTGTLFLATGTANAAIFKTESFPNVAGTGFKNLSKENQKSLVLNCEIDAEELVDFLIEHNGNVENIGDYLAIEGKIKYTLFEHFFNNVPAASSIIGDVVNCYLGDEVFENLSRERANKITKSNAAQTRSRDKIEEKFDDENLREWLMLDFEYQRQLAYRLFIYSENIQKFLHALIKNPKLNSDQILAIYQKTQLEKIANFGKFSNWYKNNFDCTAGTKNAALLAKIITAENAK